MNVIHKDTLISWWMLQEIISYRSNIPVYATCHYDTPLPSLNPERVQVFLRASDASGSIPIGPPLEVPHYYEEGDKTCRKISKHADLCVNLLALL